MSKEKIDYEEGSDNIFADLGIENPEEYFVKARLASLIYDYIEEKNWTQKYVAEILSITQPDVSNICRGLLDHFSVERLMNFLAQLNHRVTITVQNTEEDLPPKEIVIPASTSEGKQPVLL